MLSGVLTSRLQKELLDLEKDPPPGVSCYPKEDNITDLEAIVKGPPESPYEKGLFKLDIQIPLSYPFDPPQIRFVTLIYHPNIDDTGRICADILKKGQGWRPALNLSTTLLLLSQLLAQPNPDDPLDADIAKEYQFDYPTFKQKAIEYTQKYAAGEDMTAESKQPIPEKEMVQQQQKEEEIKPQKKTKLSLSRNKSSSQSQPTIVQNKKRQADASPNHPAVIKDTKAPKTIKKQANVSNSQQQKSESHCTKEVKVNCSSDTNKQISQQEKASDVKKKSDSVVVLIEKPATQKEEEKEDLSKKRSFNALFDKDIIILSDDEDPVLHSLQLDRKQKRTKMLSLSKKKKPS